jgi:hypothetical protein
MHKKTKLNHDEIYIIGLRKTLEDTRAKERPSP